MQGEDALALAYFRSKQSNRSRVDWFLGRERLARGLYVDIGAYAPKRWSNTYAFYRLGWNGITVEPNGDSARAFRSVRPRDKHIVAAVANGTDAVYYYSAGYSAGNFISHEEREPPLGFRRDRIQALSLNAILDDPFLQPGRCDLLSVDCEGFDLEVLKSNDWDRHRPRVIIAEDHTRSTSDGRGSELVDYVTALGYRTFSCTMDSVLLADAKDMGH